MGAYSGPEIVNDGLILYVDAANTRSYSGSGTAVSDLSSNNFDSTTTGNLSTTIDPVTVFDFDGVDDRILTNSANTYTSQQVSVELFVKVNGHGNWNDFVGNGWSFNGWLMFASEAVWSFGIAQNSSQYRAQIAHNNETEWTHLIGTYDGSTNVRLYLNGELVDTRTNAPNNSALHTTYNINIGNLSEPGTYKIGYVRVYDRSLTDAEVAQNYNATKTRYNL